MGGQAGRAWRKAERLFDEAVQADGAAERITAALSWFSPDGTLQTREEAQTQLREASEQLPGPQWSKVRRLLSDERTLRNWSKISSRFYIIRERLDSSTSASAHQREFSCCV